MEGTDAKFIRQRTDEPERKASKKRCSRAREANPYSRMCDLHQFAAMENSARKRCWLSTCQVAEKRLALTLFFHLSAWLEERQAVRARKSHSAEFDKQRKRDSISHQITTSLGSVCLSVPLCCQNPRHKDSIVHLIHLFSSTLSHAKYHSPSALSCRSFLVFLVRATRKRSKIVEDLSR